MNSPFECGRPVELRECPSGPITRLARSLGLLLLLGSFASLAQANELQDVQYSALPGSQVQIQLTLSAPVDEPQTFATDSPARIAIDLPGVTSKLARKSVPIGIGSVHSLVAVEASDRTRVVLNLTDPTPYDVSTSGNRIIIKVAEQGASSAAPLPVQPTAAASSVSAPTAAAPEPMWTRPARSARAAAPGPTVRDIDFRRGATGEGRVIIRLPSANTRVAVREEATRVYVDLYEVSLPQRLFRRLDVVDFATPVTAVESRPTGSNVQIEVQTEGDFDYMAYQTDELFTLDFRHLTPAEKEEMARKKVVYEGDRLSLNFQDIEVRAVLQVLADFTDLNLVASDTVQGSITLRLKNVPWDQALDIILKSKGLAMRQTGNVIMVAPAQEIFAQEQLAAESSMKHEEWADLVTQTIRLKFSKAVDMAAFLQGGGTTSGERERKISQTGSDVTGKAEQKETQNFSQSNMLSPRGKVTADSRTNTLIVVDTREQLNKILEVIDKLDVPVRQVLIESRVVIANNDFARDLGVRFGVSGSMGSSGGHELLIGGGQDGYLSDTGNFYTGPFGLSTETGAPFNSTLVDSDGKSTLITNLPAAAASGSINFLLGKVGSYLLQLELSAMQKEGRGEIVSSPRVLTSDQTKATIKVGQQIPYKTVSDKGTETQFKDAVLQLDVTPHITPDERVMMDLMVSKDSANFAQATSDGVPIDTRSVTTSVLVSNGETLVLGGVFERQKSFAKEQIPWVGDIPVLGRLFKEESKTDTNSELLIFVTPKILKSNGAQTP